MKIALFGFGKMGKTIESLAIKAGHTIVFKKGSDFEEGTLAEADTAIEFSTPLTAVKNIKTCFAHNIPVVCGTTGWLEDYKNVLKLCEERNGSFIYASNFSIGVNLFFKLNEYAARLMQPWKEYDVSIEEVHHTQKKDAPSGTAITLANTIEEFSDKKGWELENSSDNKIIINAKRLDDIKGTHLITYTSTIDDIVLTHNAHSRDGFAKGAILAASWLKDKKGVFSMKEVLGLDIRE